jgi:hypothetical protein
LKEAFLNIYSYNVRFEIIAKEDETSIIRC